MSARMPPQRIGCLRRFRPAGRARWRLLCFPHAGGGALAYRALAVEMPECVDVLAVQYGAREDRYREPASTSVHDRVADAISDAGTLPPLPWVVFGHSMGALLAFEAAKLMGRMWPDAPRLLIVSGRDAPVGHGCAGDRRVPTDDEILAKLRTLDATPPALLHDDGLARALLPALRADYAMLARYTDSAEARLPCSLVAWAGRDDPEVTEDGVNAWAERTHGPFYARWIDGNHFWWLRQPGSLRDHLLKELEAPTGTAPGDATSRETDFTLHARRGSDGGS